MSAVSSSLAQQSQPLQLSIAVEQPAISAPFPARLLLHFHNSGNKNLWLYKPARDAAHLNANALNSNSEGSALAAHLEPASPPKLTAATSMIIPGTGTTLRSADFPHPALVQLAPGGDAEQTAVVHISPASFRTESGTRPLWGAYRMFVVYSARFSNGNSIRSSLGLDVWEGTLASNAVPLTLAPPAAANHGSISGTVLNRDRGPEGGILVSLSDWQERLIAQQVTSYDGGFSFTSLPLGRYWVTVRRPGAMADTGFFEHADLSDSQPEAQMRLIMLDEEIYEARQMRHKPVLFRVTDSAGHPVAGALLGILWSSGTVLDHVKSKVSENGLAQVNLLPGSNYVTIRKHGCPDEDRLADVAEGGGIDGFSFVFDCGR